MGLHDRDYMKGTGKHRWADIMWPDAATTIVIVNVAVFLLQRFGIASEHGFDPQTQDLVTRPWGELSINALLQCIHDYFEDISDE